MLNIRKCAQAWQNHAIRQASSEDRASVNKILIRISAKQPVISGGLLYRKHICNGTINEP